jgi:hypothetical protein
MVSVSADMFTGWPRERVRLTKKNLWLCEWYNNSGQVRECGGKILFKSGQRSAFSMDRKLIINFLVDRHSSYSYLEIGVKHGETFGEIHCPRKVGVDPDPASRATYTMTSDEFFEINRETFDIVLIDGLHHAPQAYRDIINSLTLLNEGGFVVIHDCNPVSEEAQLVPRKSPGAWNGDTWKAFVRARALGRDMCVVNCDHGVGIIGPCKAEPFRVTQELTWENLQRNREKWLNMIEKEDFKAWMKKPAAASWRPAGGFGK